MTALLALGLITASLLLAPRPAAASPGWELILDRPTPDFGGIDFVSDSEGWLVAGAGLLHTTDGGATWQEAAPLSGTDVDFADEDHGWLVGLGGAIYATTDGETWSPQESGTRVHLQDVVALSSTDAWAVGSSEGFSDVIKFPLASALLHTTNGGTTWQHVEIPVGTWFAEIVFVGDQGWAVGKRVCGTEPCQGITTSVLLRTADQGTTWSVLEAGVPNSARNLIVANEQLGWLLGVQEDPEGYFSTVHRTTDGGTTWEQLPLVAQSYDQYSSMAFRDTSTGWLIVRNSSSGSSTVEVRRTLDGGSTWATVAQIDLGGGGFVRRVTTAAGELFITGGGPALRSTDGGSTWQEMEHPAVALGSVDFVDRRTGYAIGGFDLLRTDDAGRTWRTVGEVPALTTGLEFVSVSQGFTLHSECSQSVCHSIVRRTEDGGQSWKEVYSPRRLDRQARDVQFVDAEHGWVVFRNGVALTADGGATWAEHLLSDPAQYLFSADLIDTEHAWARAVTYDPPPATSQLLRSQDGGRSWEVVHSQTEGEITLIDFVDGDHGWYVANVCNNVEPCRGRLFGTDDGGVTWIGQDFDPGRYAFDLLFVDRLNGWLSVNQCTDVACTGGILHSADGGKTWLSQQSGDRLRGRLFFVDVQTGWLQPFQTIGLGGGPPQRTLLYHTTDGGGGPIGKPTVLPDVGGDVRGASTGAAAASLLLLTLGGALALAAFRMRRTRA